MRSARVALLVVVAILASAACTDSEGAGGEPSDFFGRDPNAQATIQAEHPSETTAQIDIPSSGVLHATAIVNDINDGHTRTESRFWFEDGVVSLAEYEIYDAVTGELLETQTTSGGSTTSSAGWTLPMEPDRVRDLLPALSATFLVEVAEMTEVDSAPGTRAFEYRASWDDTVLIRLEIEADTNVIVRERRTRNGEVTTERHLSYEFLTGDGAPTR